jgi:hypothetical protein
MGGSGVEIGSAGVGIKLDNGAVEDFTEER